MPAEVLVAAVEKQKKTVQWCKDGGQFIPYPATWLRQGRWEDAVEVEVEQAAKRKSWTELAIELEEMEHAGAPLQLPCP